MDPMTMALLYGGSLALGGFDAFSQRRQRQKQYEQVQGMYADAIKRMRKLSGQFGEAGRQNINRQAQEVRGLAETGMVRRGTSMTSDYEHRLAGVEQRRQQDLTALESQVAQMQANLEMPLTQGMVGFAGQPVQAGGTGLGQLAMAGAPLLMMAGQQQNQGMFMNQPQYGQAPYGMIPGYGSVSPYAVPLTNVYG